VLSSINLVIELTESRYLLINYHLADLILRVSSNDRKSTLRAARDTYEKYLGQLDQYSILNEQDKKLYNAYLEDPTSFSTISTSDPNARRNAKISNFKQEKELKRKLEVRE
jgi:immunoglobulin-binding protein 1